MTNYSSRGSDTSHAGTVALAILITVLLPATIAIIAGAVSSASINKKEAAVAMIKNGVEYEYETEPIAYETKYGNDGSIEYGHQLVVSEGEAGEKSIKYEVTYEDDVVVSRKKVGETVVKKPVNRVIAKGTKNVWHCKDVTSFDRNPYNDNYCEDSHGNYRYVPDSTARSLDKTYYPGKSGAAYYNSF